MTLTKREKQIGAVTILVFVILALDRFLLTPYIEHRDRLFSEEQNLLIEYRKARGVLSQWKELSLAFEETLKKDDKDEKENNGLTAKQKKLPQGLQDAILKKQGESPKKDKDKEEVKDEKEEKSNGLTDKQKKLPQALQDAILKKQKGKK